MRFGTFFWKTESNSEFIRIYNGPIAGDYPIQPEYFNQLNKGLKDDKKTLSDFFTKNEWQKLEEERRKHKRMQGMMQRQHERNKRLGIDDGFGQLF